MAGAAILMTAGCDFFKLPSRPGARRSSAFDQPRPSPEALAAYEADTFQIDPVGDAITEDEADTLLTEIAHAILDQDVERFRRVISLRSILRGLLDEPEVQAHFQSPSVEEALCQGMLYADLPKTFLTNVASRHDEIVSLTKLGRRDTPDGIRAVLRMDFSDGTFTFLEFTGARGQAREIRIVDMKIDSEVESVTQSLKRNSGSLLSMAMNARTRSELERFAGHGESVKVMARLSASGQHQDVLTRYNQLPKVFQKNPTLQQLRLLALRETQPMEYERLVAEIKRARPDDLMLAPFIFQDAIDQHDWPTALAYLDQLDRRYAPDSLLMSIRATIELEQGHDEEAEELAWTAHNREPGLYNPIDLLIALSLKRHDYDQAAFLLDHLLARFDLDLQELLAEEIFDGFRESEVGRHWIKQQTAPQADPVSD